jgi:hypothetical protein
VHSPYEAVYSPYEAVYSPLEALYSPYEAVYSPLEAIHAQAYTPKRYAEKKIANGLRKKTFAIEVGIGLAVLRFGYLRADLLSLGNCALKF